MNNYHSLAYAIYADRFDPLVVMAHTRKVSSPSPAVRLIRENAYRVARNRSAKLVDLPSDTPFNVSPETAAYMNRLVRA